MREIWAKPWVFILTNITEFKIDSHEEGGLVVFEQDTFPPCCMYTLIPQHFNTGRALAHSEWWPYTKIRPGSKLGEFLNSLTRWLTRKRYL